MLVLFIFPLMSFTQGGPKQVSVSPVSSQVQPPSNSQKQATAQNRPPSSWTDFISEIETSGSAIASLCGATISLIALLFTLWLNGKVANRTVRVEGQKLLLEINKQYLANPELFAIYDSEYPKLKAMGFQKHGSLFKRKLEALAYMKINVFEIIYAVHPGIGSPFRKLWNRIVRPKRSAWEVYFADSIAKCSLVRTELETHPTLYNDALISAFRKYNQNNGNQTIPNYDEVVAADSHGDDLARSFADGIVSALHEYVNPQNPKFEERVRSIVAEEKLASNARPPQT